jgi:phage baseplate assembly protein W
MAIELGKVNVSDLTQNDYKILGIGVNTTSESNGIFAVNFTTISQAKNNLKNLILTKKGERLMQPDFGCDIWKILFEPIIEGQIESKIEQTILEAIDIWLPYLNVDEIVFDYDDADIDANRIALDIKFSLKSNKNIRDSVQIDINN